MKPCQRDIRGIVESTRGERFFPFSDRLPGQPIRNIRTACENAGKKAGLEDVVIHDLKHTAITRWATAGVPQEAAMKASGHKSLAVHYRYANLQEADVKRVFRLFNDV